MKGFAIKASISEYQIFSQGKGGEKTVGGKVFLVEDCRDRRMEWKKLGSVFTPMVLSAQQ